MKVANKYQHINSPIVNRLLKDKKPDNVRVSRELLECLRDNTLKLKELEGCMGSDKYGQELYEVDEVLRT